MQICLYLRKQVLTLDMDGKICDGRIVSPIHEALSTLMVQPSSALTLTVSKSEMANCKLSSVGRRLLLFSRDDLFYAHTTICSTSSTVNANLLAKDINFTNEAFTDLREEDWKLKLCAQVSRYHALKERDFFSFVLFSLILQTKSY